MKLKELKFKPCNKCEYGYVFTEDYVYKCDCLKSYDQEIYFMAKFYQSKLNPKILDYKITDYVGIDGHNNLLKVKRYINDFRETFHKINLYLYGTNGTQKTTLASYIGREVIKQNYTVYFIYMDTLVYSLSETRPTEEVKNLNDQWLQADLLIIDDCFDRNKAKPYSTGFQISYLDSFLRKRLEQLNKATIFTANISTSDISDVWGASIQALVKRSVEELEFIDQVQKDVVSKYNHLGNLWKSRS